MSLYKHFKTDTAAEQKGVVLEYPHLANDDGSVPSVRIARAGGSNDAYLKCIDVKFKPHRRAIQNGTLPRKIWEKLTREAFAETVVIGWENVQDETGKSITFSKDAALKLLEDLPELFKDIQEQSSDIALYRADVQEMSAKN
jgi:hypothetical protein